jgi:hypothetical protein
LGRIELGPSEPLSAVLEREKDDLNWGALIVVITPTLPPEAGTSLLGLRNAGFEVRAILVGRTTPADSAGLEAFGVPTAVVRSEADISGLGI